MLLRWLPESSSERVLNGHSMRGSTMVELIVMVGLLAILATGIASISNYGFMNLRNVRIGNDLQAVENLVVSALKRPPTVQELGAGDRICKKTLANFITYTGAKVEKIDVRDPNGKSLLTPFKTKLYTPTATVSAAITKPIEVIYPDDADSGNLRKFDFYLTQLLVIGEKDANDPSVGSKVTRARIPMGVIARKSTDTKGPNAVYDCIVNPTDYKKICLMLGGRFTEDPSLTPRCLFTKLPVATNWPNVPTPSTFDNGDLYIENVLGIGDKTNINSTRGLWSLARGSVVGGTSAFGMAAGQSTNGAIGFFTNFQNEGFFSLTANRDNLMTYPRGHFNLRTYGDRPWVFDNVNNGPEKTGMVMSGPRQFFYTEGGIISARMQDGVGFLTGTQTVTAQEGIGLLAHYRDNRRVMLGRSTDNASGFFFSDNAIVSGSKTLGGAYWAGNLPGGGVVFKAYGGSDLVFQVEQKPNCLDCTAMVIKGKTGNISIGHQFAMPEAKLHVRAGHSGLSVAQNATLPGLRVDGNSELLGKTDVKGNTIINGNLVVTGEFRSRQTIYASSDEKLKTEIRPVSNALERILKLHGVYYRWKNDAPNSPRTIGLIAQDVEKTFPEVVSQNANGIKSVAYANLVAPIVEAIRERQQQIDRLKQERDQIRAGLNQVITKLCRKQPTDPLCKRTHEERRDL